jgi:hypothetical protein
MLLGLKYDQEPLAFLKELLLLGNVIGGFLQPGGGVHPANPNLG